MDYLEKKVWELLQNNEQVVLSLIHAQNMPLASVAKILGKRTYQIRRLNFQAIKIYRLFHDYLEEDPSKDIYPEGASEMVAEYILMAIDSNITPSKIKLLISAKYDTPLSLISSELRKYLQELEDNEDPFLTILREVDRYRTRFLPTSLQWPSPYRRKRNREFKRLGSKIWEYDSYILNMEYPKAKNYVYIPISTSNGFRSVKLPDDRQTIKMIEDTLHFPYYKDKSEAVYLAEIIFNYHQVKRRNHKIGTKYLYQLRITLEKAENFNKLFRIPTNVKVDYAFIENDRQLKQLMDTKAKNVKSGAKRAPDELFSI